MATELEIAAAGKAMREMRGEPVSLYYIRLYEQLAKAGLEVAEQVRSAPSCHSFATGQRERNPIFLRK